LPAQVSVTATEAESNEPARDLQRLAQGSRISQLGEMSAAIAHEIRQPLTAIVFTGQAVKRQLANSNASPGQLGEMLDDIVKAGEHAGEVIERLQAMTRREAVPFRDVAVNELVAEALRWFRRDLELREITPRLELANDLPTVRGDPTQLIQILGNLIRNACEAMASCGGEDRVLTVRTRTEVDHLVSITVMDTGPGLTATALAGLFQAFHSDKPGGMGLGLSLCRSIATAHAGEIVGGNKLSERGAVFILTLPATPQSPKDESTPYETADHDLCGR
jgi:two-component system sensor kinase FixL